MGYQNIGVLFPCPGEEIVCADASADNFLTRADESYHKCRWNLEVTAESGQRRSHVSLFLSSKKQKIIDNMGSKE
jgi:hypothetical protein